jgi:hypothetical protein
MLDEVEQSQSFRAQARPSGRVEYSRNSRANARIRTVPDFIIKPGELSTKARDEPQVMKNRAGK